MTRLPACQHCDGERLAPSPFGGADALVECPACYGLGFDLDLALRPGALLVRRPEAPAMLPETLRVAWVSHGGDRAFVHLRDYPEAYSLDPLLASYTPAPPEPLDLLPWRELLAEAPP